MCNSQQLFSSPATAVDLLEFAEKLTNWLAKIFLEDQKILMS
jgi:hypothetical protein